MSIYEYDEEKHLRMEREEWLEDGLKQGRIEGRSEVLTELIKKKITKNKTLEEIADDLEMNISDIEKIAEELKEKNKI